MAINDRLHIDPGYWFLKSSNLSMEWAWSSPLLPSYCPQGWIHLFMPLLLLPLDRLYKLPLLALEVMGL